MRKLLMIAACVGSLSMAGCVTAPPKKQALDVDAIRAVQAEIKRQVGVYLLSAAAKPTSKPEDFWCGTGNIDFDISTIKAQLTTSIEKIDNAGLKLQIPWSAVTIGPSGSIKGDATNTQELNYNIWPLEFSRQIALKATSISDQKPAPIAEVLLSLRDALINSAKKSSSKSPQACFTDYNPDKPAADAGNTFKLGLSYTTDTTGGLEIKVGILDFNATTEWKGTTGNTLTVSFVQRGLAQLQRAKDEVDVLCKYPKKESDKACLDATAAFRTLQENTGVAFHTSAH